MWIEDFNKQKITQEELNDFHAVDRELYATLVYDLWRDPIEAIQMMAIWIWLERVTIEFPDLTRRILTLPSQWIDKLADEALLCWACIDDVSIVLSSSAMDFPLMTVLLNKEMPIDFFRKYRDISIMGINEVINFVCANCFKDIWDGAIARNAHMDFIQNMASLDPVAPPQTVEIQPDERTLFITFSRGYPVTESEVKDFFTGQFGECIESFYMQEVPDGEHALFAKIVLNHLSYVHAVLNGESKAKFTINGKHVWMRKFIPKHQRV